MSATESAGLPPPPTAVPSSRIESIEDLYAAFPALGEEEFFKVQIHRIAPKTFLGSNIAGVLYEQPEPIYLEEIAQSFGGGEYEVAVFGPSRGRPNTDGTPRIRQLAKVRVKIPGNPRIDGGGPTRQEGSMLRMGVGEAPQAQVIAAQSIARREERRDQALSAGAELVQRQAVEHANSLRGEIDAMRKEANKRDDEIRALRDSLVEERRKAISADSEARREMEERHKLSVDALRSAFESEKKAMHEGFSREKDALRERYEAQIVEIRRQSDERMVGHNAELARLRDELATQMRSYESRINEMVRQHNEAKSELREHYEKRERDVRDQGKERIGDLERQFKDRLDEAERRSVREAAAAQSAFEREVRAIRDSAASDVKLEKSIFATKESSLVDRLTRAEADNARLSEEVDELRAAAHQDPETFLAKTEQNARTLLKMVPASEAKGGGEDEEENVSWSKVVSRGVMNVINKAPELVEKVMEIRQQNIVVNAQAQAQAAAVAQQTQQQQRRAPRPRMMPPPPWQGPGGDRSPEPFGPPVLVGPTYQAGPPPQLQVGVVAPHLMPTPPPPPAPLEQRAEQQVPAPLGPPPFQSAQPAQQALQQPRVQQGQQSDVQLNVTEEQMAAFINELESAHQLGMSASLFSSGVVERIDRDTLRTLLQRFTPEMLFQLLESTPEAKTASISTRTGRKFVRDVWALTAKAVEAG